MTPISFFLFVTLTARYLRILYKIPSKDYVVELSEERGLNVIHYEELDGFRYEHGVEVRGHLFVLQKEAREPNSEL